MTLAGTVNAIIKPTALVLNIVVATSGTMQFSGLGHFRWLLFWPLPSIPAAYYGGTPMLPTRVLNVLIGFALPISAARMLIQLQLATKTMHHPSRSRYRQVEPV